ncbi:cytochrome b [Capsicum chinense]|nr:cytochrome b [Capsicum chinense]
MIVTAFIGYVLPWGQMSFWGATVITSLASAIPVVGDTIVTWLWGGFSVDNATLNHIFSLHHLLLFILVGASLLHLAALHQYGSNNPLGVHSEIGTLLFHTSDVDSSCLEVLRMQQKRRLPLQSIVEKAHHLVSRNPPSTTLLNSVPFSKDMTNKQVDLRCFDWSVEDGFKSQRSCCSYALFRNA